MGIMLAWGGIHQAGQSQKFGKPQASVAEDRIRPGDNFQFLYRQQCQQLTSIYKTGVFLVFRETVSYYDGNETATVDVDRLVHQFNHAGRVYAPNEFIEEEHVFQIPTRVMGIKNPYMKRKNVEVQTMWVVKVHINLEKEIDIWKEYEVPVNSEPIEDRLDDTFKELDNRFDVLLTAGGFMAQMHILNVMSTLLPHLRQGQIGDLFSARPCLLLERVAAYEAQTIKEQLEAAGAVVNIEPSADG